MLAFDRTGDEISSKTIKLTRTPLTVEKTKLPQPFIQLPLKPLFLGRAINKFVEPVGAEFNAYSSKAGEINDPGKRQTERDQKPPSKPKSNETKKKTSISVVLSCLWCDKITIDEN